ncbi:III [Skunk adenovirus 1]|uniref:Penton protein n=1 Tax=Skunk adenovirus 1 TaxID=2698728 RepID=A0A0K0MGF9_9ADEN|nr:III [Skunk adenovirus PB1]AKC34846.1 III [Skunk adenovirus PB1]QDF59483.1 III [African pygmy hedgehog adenovirus 1]UKT59816.1 III [Raccoon adenovirus]UKT59846.1 III [Porcupine adenovirus]
MDLPSSPPPSYATAIAQAPLMYAPTVPPRYAAATEGRNSIRYSQLPPLFDTTRLYLIDNKSSDINVLNYQNDRSNFLTTIVQNANYTPLEASTQSIHLDERSRWGGQFKSILHMNIPNVTEYMFSNSFKAKLPATADKDGKILTYEWYVFTIPEGNYSEVMLMDLLNNAVVENYLQHGRQHNVKEEDMGLKFDTRNFRLGYDPETQLVMPGFYTNEAFHPDIILSPGCAIDFTNTRLNNFLGIRKRQPFQEGFIIAYEDLKGGNIPALLDLANYDPSKPSENVVPLTEDSKQRSYHVGEDPEAGQTFTSYRSWYLAYNYGDPYKGIRATTVLVSPDITCGVEQIYWSLPDLAIDPVTFAASHNPNNYPVVGTELLPLIPRTFYNAQSVYSQLLQESTNQTQVFNRFPENAILKRPPAPTIISISENVPTMTDHGTLPIKNNISGVQRVTITDARRRACPYVYKSLGIVTPRVLSSKTF